MAVYQFSALSDGQAITFNPTADVLNFDQSSIAAADIRVSISGTSARIDVVSGPFSGKDVTLLHTVPFQLAGSNVTFVDGSRLLFGDNSTAQGDDNSNTLAGGSGRDLIFGFGGSDTINIGIASFGAGDHIDGGTGFDTLNFNGYVTAALTIDFAAGTVTSAGGSATFANIERVIGGTGNDSIAGSAAAQNLTSGNGNDTLWGAGGVDTLWSGGGADVLVFREVDTANADNIGDFTSGTDKISLDATVMTALGSAGNFATGDARFWAAAGATGGHDADDRVVYNTTTRQLFYDADGSGPGAAQRIATLQSGATLVATDIVVNGEGTPPPPPPPSGPTEGDDSLVGTSGNDTIDGLGGNDTIEGLGGNDSLAGSMGADQLIGGEGNDTLHSGFDGGRPDLSADTLDGGLGSDVYHVSDDGDSILADPGGTDLVIALNSNWTLGPGLDNLDLQDSVGSAFDGTGNGLDNVIRSASEGGTLSGLGGNDVLVARHAQNTVTLRGGDGNDTLQGGGPGNQMFGDAGDDRLVAAAFYDNSMTGGAGADSFIFTQTGSFNLINDFVSGTDKIRLDATQMQALGASGNFAAGDPRFHFAAGATGGHDADDRVVYNTSTGELFYDPDGDGAQGAEIITRLQPDAPLAATDIAVDNGTSGAPGNGTGGNDSLVGTPGDDSLNGLGGNDTLRGLDGHDFLNGGEGIDTLDGGLGHDTYIVTAGDVIVADPGGIDAVITPVSWNISSGNIENVTASGSSNVSVEGNNLANRIVGNDAPNYINARAGSDTLIGNGGNDTFNMSRGGTASFGNDSIDGGPGVDTVEFGVNAVSALVADLAAGTVTGGEANGAGSSTILDIERFIGADFNDSISGSAAANYLDGRAGNDTVSGGTANDTLLGGAGNDRLAGGTGNDSLSGGAGLDSFVFGEAPASGNADRITDFSSASDDIHLDDAFHAGIGASGNFAAGDGRFWAAAGATSGHDANDRVIYNTSTGNLYYDADGSGAGAAQLITTFTGNPAIAATDIVVI